MILYFLILEDSLYKIGLWFFLGLLLLHFLNWDILLKDNKIRYLLVFLLWLYILLDLILFLIFFDLIFYDVHHHFFLLHYLHHMILLFLKEYLIDLLNLLFLLPLLIVSVVLVLVEALLAFFLLKEEVIDSGIIFLHYLPLLIQDLL